jgi:GMP synthase PP-ATPase subunit
MTADWARLPYELRDQISVRIINGGKEIDRTVSDITSKPPAGIRTSPSDPLRCNGIGGASLYV